jgi:hypothetical protein
MLLMPTSSPKMTRMFGLPADGAGCCGACACAMVSGALAPIAAAASVVPPSRMLRRLTAEFRVRHRRCGSDSRLFLFLPVSSVVHAAIPSRCHAMRSE